MFKKAMLEVLEEDLQVYGRMIKGTEELLLREQERLGGQADSSRLQQLRRTLDRLEKQAVNTQHQISKLGCSKVGILGVGEI